MTSGSRTSPRICTTPAASSPSSTSACSSTSATGSVRSRRASTARTARSGSLERDEEALAGVAVALGLERARREARGDPDLGVVVAREPAQHRQHLERAELGEVAHRRDLDLGLELALEHRERGVAAGAERISVSAVERGRRLVGIAERRAATSRSTALTAPIRPSAAIAARRSARGAPSARNAATASSSAGKPEPAGGVRARRRRSSDRDPTAGGARTAAARGCGTRGPSPRSRRAGRPPCRRRAPPRAARTPRAPRPPTRPRARGRRDRRAAGTRRAARCASAPRARPPRAPAPPRARRRLAVLEPCAQRTCARLVAHRRRRYYMRAVSERFHAPDHRHRRRHRRARPRLEPGLPALGARRRDGALGARGLGPSRVPRARQRVRRAPPRDRLPRARCRAASSWSPRPGSTTWKARVVRARDRDRARRAGRARARRRRGRSSRWRPAARCGSPSSCVAAFVVKNSHCTAIAQHEMAPSLQHGRSMRRLLLRRDRDFGMYGRLARR